MRSHSSVGMLQRPHACHGLTWHDASVTEPHPPRTPEAAVTGAGARAEAAAIAVHLRFGGRFLGRPPRLQERTRDRPG